MTLVVAGIEGDAVWMAADALITGGPLTLREREFFPKIEAGNRSLISFAGDLHFGHRAARRAAQSADQTSALAILREASTEGGVEFAFGHWEQGPSLFHIANGRATAVQTLHLGAHQAFEELQAIRHNDELPYAPNALKTLICGSRGPVVPQALSGIIRPMMDLFATRQERDVGGWVLPYALDSTGPHLCEYGYSVSDPIFGEALLPGDVLPHGTAQGGGATLSVTELRSRQGLVVYWLQLPGGLVLLPTEAGYEGRWIDGAPSEFKLATMRELGEEATLLVSDRAPQGPVQRLNILRDEEGNPAVAIAGYGDAFTMSVLNVASPFRSLGTLPVTADLDLPPLGVTLAPTPDGRGIQLTVGTSEPLVLSATEIDRLQAELADLRAGLTDAVPTEIPAGVPMSAQVDPIWRTLAQVHAGVPGVLLHLRHSGYGWISYILPFSEARSLGEWLANEGNSHRGSDPESST